MVCWMTETHLAAPGRQATRIKHTTRSARAVVKDLQYRLDVNTLHRDEDAVGLVAQRDRPGHAAHHAAAVLRRVPAQPRHRQLHPRRRGHQRHRRRRHDPRARCRVTERRAPTNVTWHPGHGRPRPTDRRRAPRSGSPACPARASPRSRPRASAQLVAAGRPAYLLDGDNLRHGLNGDLGFSAEDRAENVRRVGHVARLFADAGLVALVPLISPYRADRDAGAARCTTAAGPAASSRCSSTRRSSSASSATPRASTPRPGRRAQGFTGIDDPYEAPERPELVLRPDDGDPDGHGRRGPRRCSEPVERRRSSIAAQPLGRRPVESNDGRQPCRYRVRAQRDRRGQTPRSTSTLHPSVNAARISAWVTR